jgi:hypothetical protein
LFLRNKQWTKFLSLCSEIFWQKIDWKRPNLRLHNQFLVLTVCLQFLAHKNQLMFSQHSFWNFHALECYIMAPHTLKAMWSIEKPVTTCTVAWYNIAEDCHDKLKSHYSLTVLTQIFPWFISELQTVSDHVICCTFLWRICDLNGENLREENVIDTSMHCRLVYCYTVDVGTITKHGCPLMCAFCSTQSK